MIRFLLVAFACVAAIPANAQIHLTPGVTLSGDSNSTLDLAGVGTDCGNLAIDLSAKTIRCDANSSVNRLSNVNNVLGPLASVPFQAFGNSLPNQLVDRNGMSVLQGNGGDDTLTCKPVSSCYGGAGVDTFVYDGADRVYYHKVKGKKIAYPIIPRAKDLAPGELVIQK